MKTKTFLRDDESGLLYCNDGLFRGFVQFGNDSGCLKFWSKAGFADLKAKKLARCFEGKWLLAGHEKKKH